MGDLSLMLLRNLLVSSLFSGNLLMPSSESAVLILSIQMLRVIFKALNGLLVKTNSMAQKTMAIYLNLHLILLMSRMAIMV